MTEAAVSAATAFEGPSSPKAASPSKTRRKPAPQEALRLDPSTIRSLWGQNEIKIIDRDVWVEASKRHRGRMLDLIGGKLQHDSHHPIYNFLFEYYHFKPQVLLDYSPGAEPVLLKDAKGTEGGLLAGKGRMAVIDSSDGISPPMGGSVWIPEPQGGGILTEKHINSLRFGHDVLKATMTRPPVLICYGVHEWAMLYRPPTATSDEPYKYQSLPLRISQEALNEYVESKPIRCTHFDAFRFFTSEARPLNIHASDLSTRRGQIMQEQPGCLHANMDCFKWAIKLGPYVPSDLLEETLALAIECRILDMRASPYDLKAIDIPDFAFDITPVRVETPEGRKQYQALQEQLYWKAIPLRQRLIDVYDHFFRSLDLRQEDVEQQRTAEEEASG